MPSLKKENAEEVEDMRKECVEMTLMVISPPSAGRISSFGVTCSMDIDSKLTSFTHEVSRNAIIGRTNKIRLKIFILLIVLLSFALKAPLQGLAQLPGFGWIQTVGENLISIFVVFALLYWVGMARMVRSQVLMLKESEYVTAARALGVSSGKIIKNHLLTNCIGTLIVTTTLQIPSSIFTESFLSFLGMGVAVPLPSLGSLASDAINGMNTNPHLLFIPAIVISLIILSFNLLGDGLRDAFDPKLKN